MPWRAFSTPVLIHREGERERKRAGCPTLNGYKRRLPAHRDGAAVSIAGRRNDHSQALGSSGM